MLFKNKEGKVRSGWKIIGMLLAVQASMYLLYFVVSMGFSLWNRINGVTTMISIGEQIQAFDRRTKIFFLLRELLVVLVPIWIWRSWLKQPTYKMGLRPLKNHFQEFAVGLGLGAMAITFVFLVLVATGNAQVSSWTPHLSKDLFLYLITYISVGFAEEILGRGYINSVLAQTKSIPMMLVISSVIFSLLHLGNNAFSLMPFLNLFFIGILFSVMYLWSGNLWMCIGFHITWNYFQGCILGLAVSGTGRKGLITTVFPENNLFNGGAFGPEGGIVVTVSIVLCYLFVKWYYQNTEIDFLQMVNTADSPVSHGKS